MEHEAFYIVDQWFYYLLLNPFIQFLPSKKLGIFSDFSYSTLQFAFMLVNQFLLLQFVFGSTSFLPSIEPTEKQTLLIWEHVVLNNGKGCEVFTVVLKANTRESRHGLVNLAWKCSALFITIPNWWRMIFKILLQPVNLIMI